MTINSKKGRADNFPQLREYNGIVYYFVSKQIYFPLPTDNLCNTNDINLGKSFIFDTTNYFIGSVTLSNE
jgi:hypothetical protein